MYKVWGPVFRQFVLLLLRLQGRKRVPVVKPRPDFHILLFHIMIFLRQVMSLERMLRARSAQHASPVQSAQGGGNVGSVREARASELVAETDSNDTVLEKAGSLQERIGAGCGGTDSIGKLSTTSGSRAGAFNVFVLDDGMGIASDPAEPETCQALVKTESAMQGMWSES